MADAENRPVPRSGPIDPNEKSEILYELLVIERARLAEAVRIEKERRIVFPETTVIIKDIKSLLAALSGGTSIEAIERDTIQDLLDEIKASNG